MIAIRIPRRHWIPYLVGPVDSTSQALAFQNTQLNFSEVEPTALFGWVVEIPLLSPPPGWCQGVRVSMVHDQRPLFRLQITFFQRVSNAMRPVDPGMGIRDLDRPSSLEAW